MIASRASYIAIAASLTIAAAAHAQRPGPQRAEGEGPFQTLILQNVIVIDGTGSPPIGPMDITITQNRITRVASAGTPGLPPQQRQTPAGARVMDLRGHYVMPGFVDLHLHTGDPRKTPDAEYVYKLWMAHGITSGRGVEFGPMPFSMSERARSARNEITAPRMFV
jgi:adenine deaminase